MPKKCMICEKEASYCVRGSSECYCDECADDNFSDLELLEKVEKEDKNGKVQAVQQSIPQQP